MYHIDADLSDKRSKKEESLFSDYGQKFAEFKISFCTRLKLNYFSMCKICCYSKRDRKLKRVMKKAEKQINKALDTRKIIRNQRALKTLLRLTLSKPANKLIHMQRRSNVKSCLQISGPLALISAINNPAADMTAIKSDMDNSKLVDYSYDSNSSMNAPLTS